jgi:hypothetical protein
MQCEYYWEFTSGKTSILKRSNPVVRSSYSSHDTCFTRPVRIDGLDGLDICLQFVNLCLSVSHFIVCVARGPKYKCPGKCPDRVCKVPVPENQHLPARASGFPVSLTGFPVALFHFFSGCTSLLKNHTGPVTIPIFFSKKCWPKSI